MDEHVREPCLWRMVDFCGGSFASGCIGTSILEFVKAFRNAPKGIGRRFRSGVTAVQHRAPVAGGSCAAVAVVFSIIHCSSVYVRKKEDGWNYFICGGATTAILFARDGVPTMISAVIFSGCIYALYEGVDKLVNRFTAKPTSQ